MTLHLRPTAQPTGFRHENLYEDWLQTLSSDQFYDHLAGRLHGPEIGARKMPKAWTYSVIAACVALVAAIAYATLSK